jgi:uncharacterized Zn finger protein
MPNELQNHKRNIVQIKALQRASRRLEVRPLDPSAGRYLVTSASQPGLRYHVQIDPVQLSGHCTCRWAQHGGINCKHVLAVLREHYAAQGRQISFWRTRGAARRQHRSIIAGEELFATLRRRAA